MSSLDRQQNRASATIKAKTIIIPKDREIVGDTADLIESIRNYGVLQPIGVRRLHGGQPVLVWGYKRHAAVMQIDANAEIEIIDLGDITDDEAAVAEIEENLRRHQYSDAERAKQTARSVELREKVIAARMAEEKRAAGLSGQNVQKPTGRPPEPRAEAIRQEAAAQNVSTKTVDRQLKSIGVGVANVTPKKAKPRAQGSPPRAHGTITKQKSMSLEALKKACDNLGGASRLKLLAHIRDGMSTAEWSEFIAMSPPRALPPETPNATVSQ